MPKKQVAIDIVVNEIAAAYSEDYFFDLERFGKYSQRNIDYICKYLVNELNILGFDYDRGYGEHFDIIDAERLIYEVVGRWKSEIVQPDTYPKEKGFKGVDRFMQNRSLSDENLFYGGGWDQVVTIYEASMGKNNVCGFFYCT